MKLAKQNQKLEHLLAKHKTKSRLLDSGAPSNLNKESGAI
jgi:hypothetical protein